MRFRRRYLLLSLSLVSALGVVLPHIGVERQVGDHEMGVNWELFVKHRASLQWRFTNPAQHGLEVLPFDELTPDERKRFIDFCSIRFGNSDVSSCYKKLSARAI
jgi:hypothetical protein